MKKVKSNRPNFLSARECLYTGAIYGAKVGLIYAIVECAFSCILPWFIGQSHEYVPLHSGFTTLLFLIYPVLGFILVGLSGFFSNVLSRQNELLQKIDPDLFYPLLSTLTVFLALLINLVISIPPSINNMKSLPHLFIINNYSLSADFKF